MREAEASGSVTTGPVVLSRNSIETVWETEYYTEAVPGAGGMLMLEKRRGGAHPVDRVVKDGTYRRPGRAEEKAERAARKAARRAHARRKEAT